MVSQVRARKLFTPLFEGVAVQVNPQEQTPSGIMLPETAQAKGYNTPTGWVVAVGPDVKQVKEGDLVLLGNAPMAVVTYGGQPDLVLVAESHLAGIVDGANRLRKRISNPADEV